MTLHRRMKGLEISMLIPEFTLLKSGIHKEISTPELVFNEKLLEDFNKSREISFGCTAT